MKRFFLAILFLLVAAQVQAANFWVRPTGTMSGCTASGSAPATDAGYKSTIVAGIACLAGGDSLFIRTGTYNEVIAYGTVPGGTISARTIISGYLTENPILRPSGSANPDNTPVWLHPAAAYVTLQNFTVDSINQLNNGRCIQIEGNGDALIGMTCLNAPRDAFTLKGPNQVARNNIVRDCGRIQPPEEANTKGGGFHVLGDGFSGSTGSLLEGNLIEGCRAGGIWVQQNALTQNVTVRNNIIRNFGTYSSWSQPPGHNTTAAGINIGHGLAIQVYGNIVYRGRAIPALSDGSCVFFWGNPSNIQIYNNVCYDVDDGVAGTASNVAVKNNIFSFVNTGTTLLGGTGNTVTNNLTNPTVSATFVNAAGGDFSQLPGSPSKDAGTATITTEITLTCAGNCDIGWSEMPKLLWCSATGNTLSLVFDNPRFPPLSNLSVTGQTGTIDGSSRTLSSPVAVGSNQINITFSGAAVDKTATSAGTSSPITDSALLGNLAAMVQKVDNWTTMDCNVVGGGISVLTQVSFRFHDLPGTEAAPKCLSASGSCTGMENVNASIQQNGCFRARIKIACTGADCLPFAPVIRSSRAAAAYVAIPNAYAAENVKYYGTSDTSPDIPNHLSVVASELLTSGHAANISSSFLRSDVGVPNLDLSENSETEIEFTACFDRDEAIGTTHDFRVYKGDGAVLNAYTVTPRVTVVAPGLSGGISSLGPWDVEMRLGSNLALGTTRRRKGDGSKFVYPDVPKSAVIKALK